MEPLIASFFSLGTVGIIYLSAVLRYNPKKMKNILDKCK